MRKVYVLPGEATSIACRQAQATTFLHSLAQASHDSMHVLQGSCLSACFLHSAAQSLHVSIATLARHGR